MNTGRRIRDLEKELRELRKLEKDIKQLSVNKQVATYLHDNICGWNHEDGCGWFHESDDWEKSSHQEWLKKADSLLAYIVSNKIAKTDLQKVNKSKDLIDILKNIKF
jgi:hypothetical protein